MATKIGITEARGQYIVVDDEGNQYGSYDDRKKAAAKAREVKRDMEGGNGTSSSGGSSLQDKAAKFSQGVNKRLGVGSSQETSDSASSEPGRFQQFATSFAEGVNSKAKGASASNGGSGRTVTVEWLDETEEWRVSGPTAGFGTFDTKSAAVTKAKQVYNSNDEYSGLQVQTRAGAVQPSRSKGTAEGATGDTQDTGNGGSTGALGGLLGGGGGGGDGDSPTLPGGMMSDSDEDAGGPSLAFMGGGGESEGSPSLPGFGMEGDGDSSPSLGFMGESDGESPQLPGIGGGSGDVSLPFGGESESNQGGPMVPGFGMGMEDDPDEDGQQEFPWM